MHEYIICFSDNLKIAVHLFSLPGQWFVSAREYLCNRIQRKKELDHNRHARHLSKAIFSPSRLIVEVTLSLQALADVTPTGTGQ